MAGTGSQTTHSVLISKRILASKFAGTINSTINFFAKSAMVGVARVGMGERWLSRLELVLSGIAAENLE